jgi:hypothetical protein
MARPSSIFTSNPVEALYVQFFGIESRLGIKKG